MRNLPPVNNGFPALLRKVLAVAATLTIVVLAVMFSMVVIALVLLIGLIAWGYLMWKTRHLRKMMRELHARQAGATRREATQSATAASDVIEGEVVHVHTSRESR